MRAAGKVGVALGLAALALGGCATTGGSRTQITRFHLGDPIARGQIAVEPVDPALRASPEYQTYANLVQAQLTAAGFTPAANPATSEQVAMMAVEFGNAMGPPRGGLSLGVGVGGGSYGYRGGGVGGGVGVSGPVAGGRPRELAVTRLTITIKRRSDNTTVWEGRGETSGAVGSAAGQPTAAIGRIAQALFAGFPGESGRTVVSK